MIALCVVVVFLVLIALLYVAAWLADKFTEYKL
jgi:hypothetical protein